MIVYWDPQNAPLRGVSEHLMARRFEELLSFWQGQFGVAIVPQSISQGALRADISRSSPQQVFSWLQAANVTCVDVEYKDIPVLSRGFHKFAQFLLLRAAEQGVMAKAFHRLTPDEITDRLQEIVLEIETSGQSQPDVHDADQAQLQAAIAADALAEMRRSGLDVGDELPEPPKPAAPDGRYDQEYGLGVSEPEPEAIDDAWGIAY